MSSSVEPTHSVEIEFFIPLETPSSQWGRERKPEQRQQVTRGEQLLTLRIITDLVCVSLFTANQDSFTDHSSPSILQATGIFDTHWFSASVLLTDHWIHQNIWTLDTMGVGESPFYMLPCRKSMIASLCGWVKVASSNWFIVNMQKHNSRPSARGQQSVTQWNPGRPVTSGPFHPFKVLLSGACSGNRFIRTKVISSFSSSSEQTSRCVMFPPAGCWSEPVSTFLQTVTSPKSKRMHPARLLRGADEGKKRIPNILHICYTIIHSDHKTKWQASQYSWLFVCFSTQCTTI